LLVERKAMPAVITSANIVDPETSGRLFDAAYDEHARRVAHAIGGLDSRAVEANIAPTGTSESERSP